MILNKLCLVVLFTFCFNIKFLKAADCKGSGNDTQRILSLCQEFQLIRDLAPEDSVIDLIQTHMQNDIRFRKAVQFMLSPGFKEVTEQIDATATYQSLLRQFSKAGVNTTDIESVGDIFDCVLIPVLEDATTSSRSSFQTKNIVETRSLDTFAQEVGQLIPTDKLVKVLKRQLAVNKQFAAFYKVLRDSSFRSQLTSAYKNREISRPIKMLRRYQINLCNLVEYALNIFDLGPSV